MAKDLGRGEIEGILESGNFTDLKGSIENGECDCKGAPYVLDANSRKQEFSKDVTSFANAKGGIILLGVITEKKSNQTVEEIVNIRPFEQGLVDTKQYYDVIREWIYPKVEGVSVKWYPDATDPMKGIVGITIPPQGEPKKFFLIKGNVNDRDKISTVVFGYAERQQAHTVPLRIEEIHTLMVEGTKNREIQQQNDSIMAMLQEIKANFETAREPVPSIDVGELVDLRVGEALETVGLMQSPAFILSAVPIPLVDIPTLFTSRDSEVVRLLENPPELRSRGFGVKSGNDARIVGGRLRRVVCSGYKILDLWRDGVLIFAATGGSEFLSWGTKSKGPLRINQLTLIESTYEFSDLVSKVYRHFQPLPQKFRYELRLLNMTVAEDPCGIIPGPLGTYDWTFGANIHRAPSANIIVNMEDDDPYPDPPKIAFKLISELYLRFELENDKIPYTENRDGQLVISPDAILEAGRL